MSVNDQDLICVGTNRIDHFSDEPFLVLRRDDNRDSCRVIERRPGRRTGLAGGGNRRAGSSGRHSLSESNIGAVSWRPPSQPMSMPLLGLAADIVSANLSRRTLPYKVTLVATYHCNFRCEMCSIWQKESVSEMTPAEVESFFSRWSQFSWVHLTGGELFMRRDVEDVVMAVVESDRALYLLNFPTTGWFGDRTVALVEKILRRGIGRLMTTISIDGPRDLHDAMRGLPGSWERGIE